MVGAGGAATLAVGQRSGSGITHDPNNLEDESYIVKLIMRIVTVSVETVGLVKEISGCEL